MSHHNSPTEVSTSAPAPTTPATDPQQLPEITRFITTHDANGTAVFSSAFPDQVSRTTVPGALFTLAYATDTFPLDLNSDRDLTAYQHYLEHSPGLAISTGSVCRIVDIGPDVASAMHRTVSIDYGVVLEGEVELILDSGETRRLKRGDLAIQRGTNHAWKNATRTVDENGQERAGWARMLYVLLPILPLQVEGGEQLTESVDGMGVAKST
ncbi:hypothetical protein BDV27DRAFT_161332 [Aspergillus caelatus]|uniref:Cupin 2 conserved barrel domain-containing protein n=1 Tax=Aspergillus caelatus TaxID=61420 RepID=A0A5N6ZV09_9EURO|nr:uncharacterized protein BDV27DRAFT_161332 [Aspergillus caelatus]KAE8360766.1 hypothetical protein BDV27DRAFT_161332 [Aspergillus caelatus]